jgi:hypothetical protein
MTKRNPGSRSRNPMELPIDLTPQLVEKIRSLQSSVKTDYLKQQFLSKYVSDATDPPEVRRQRAINKWLATERENEATNDRLLITPGDYQILPRVAFSSFVEFCRDLISDIIGDTPPIESLIGTFSGGASTSRNRTCSNPACKYLGKAHVTASCLEWFELIRPELPGWLADGSILDIEIVPGNVMFTVPKKTDIDRCACKECDLNMFIQKGVGSYIRGRLRRIGINLNDQSINQSLAREGSVSDLLATLDLSSASDSVSDGLVSLLLPECWYTLLDAIRSRVTIIDGEEHRNHMFSSMGNGFTFELESLLFYVLAKATAFFTGTRGRISVYGDDIICPSDMSHKFTFVLGYFGFSVNSDKSCYQGPFRESCGGHYHYGLDITPFYLKGPIRTLPDLIHVANQLRKWASLNDQTVMDGQVEEIWTWLQSHVPSDLWGGGDTSYKYQLVSPHSPSRRIVEDTVRKDNGDGGYFHWLNATWRRSGQSFDASLRRCMVLGRYDLIHDLPESVQTSSRTVGTSKLRFKSVRSKAVPRLHHFFLSELV